ncbi:helicase [Sporosarcina sp. 179-K 8C2 HS]|uniref:helicase n=1 Tax=Sporosarcina sp. 179-K 8C2 HS TaxID=3142387 RepID=UPI0039A3CE84
MNIKNKNIYPNCQTITRVIEVGGLTKSQIIDKMQRQNIMVNELGKKLFADDNFTTSIETYVLKTVELTVRDLGLLEGGTITEVYRRANQLGLELCPLELGPFMRLRYLDQPEGFLSSQQQNQAPYGSITIATKILTEDDNFPKGFYLRRINDVLWLRGYVCDDHHVWEPSNRFVFVKQ